MWMFIATVGWALGGPAVLVLAAVAHRRRRRTCKPPQRRVQVDPTYVRDEFARITEAQPPELRRPNPRLYAMYLAPSEEDQNA